jgi:hypothetical protein
VQRRRDPHRVVHLTVFSWASMHASQALMLLTARQNSSKSIRFVATWASRFIRSRAGFSV